MAQGRSLGGWNTAGCTQQQCQHRTQVRRVHGRAGVASRRRPTSLQCAATNRLIYQATSQLDPGQDLDHLELEVLQPAGSHEHHEHNIVLRPLAHSFQPPAGQHLRLPPPQQEPQQSHPQPQPQQQQQQELDAVTQAFVERLYASQDMSTVSALLQQVSRQGMQQCYIIRAALKCILRLYAGTGRTARNQAAAHSCLAQLCACAAQQGPPAGQGTVSSPEPAGQSTPVASWPARNLVLLAKAMASTSWHQCDIWQAVVKATQPQAPELHPWQASQLLWAASRLQAPHQPAADPAWLDALIDRVCAGAGAMNPDSLAQALHAAARLGHLPQRACMEHLLLHGVQQRLPEWTGGQIACTLWALARFRYHPGSAWLSDVLARAEACTRSFHSGASIASTLWALAVLGHAPPKPWMEHFLWQAQRQLRACDAQAIANIVWALAKLRYRPPNSWAAEMLRMAAQHMHALPLHITRQRALGSTLQQQQAAEGPLQESGTAQEHTYASLQHTGTATSSSLVNGSSNGSNGHSSAPSSPARDPLLRASGGSACNGGTPAAQVILWPPSSQPPSHLASAPGQGSSGAPAQGFGAPAAACSAPQQQQQQDPQQVQGPPQVPAGEQYGEPNHTQPPHGVRDQTRRQTPSPPPPPWGCPMQLQRPAHRPASGAHIPQSPEPESLQTDAHSPQAGAGQAATTPPQPASAAAGLGVGPSPSELVLELFNEPVAWKGGGASPRTFTMFLWSVAQLQVLPRWPYLRRMCIAMSPALPNFTPRELASCLWSLHKLRHVPDPTMYTQLLAAVRARLPTFDTHSLVVALSAIANFQPTHPVQPPMLHALCQQLALHASQLGPLQTTSVWTSLAHLCSSKECLPASLHESLLSQLHAQLPQMNIRGMVNSVWAATQLARITGNDVHLTTGHAVLPRVMRHVRSHLSSCSHRDLIQLAVALRQANYMVPAEWLSAHESAIRRLVAQGVVSHLELQPLVEAYKHLGADVGPLLQLQAAVAAKARQAAAAAAAAAAAGWQMGATSTCAVAPVAAAAAGLPLVSALQAPQLTPEQQAVQRQLLRVDERDWQGMPAQLQHAVGSQDRVSSWPAGVQRQQQGEGGSQGPAGTPQLLSWQQSAVGHRLVRQVGPAGDPGPAALDGAQQEGAVGLGQGLHGSADGSNDASGLPPGSADQQLGVGARRMVRLSKRQEQRQRALQDLLRLNVSKPSF